MIPHVNESKGDLEDVDLAYDHEISKDVTWYHQILLNRPLKLVLAFILTAILGPLLIYQLVFYSSLDQPPTDGLSFGSCLVPRQARLLCGVGMVSSDECHSQCCYDHTNNMCFHRFPSRFSYITHRNWTEETILNPRIPIIPFASRRSLTNIRLSIDEISATHLSLTFYDSEDSIESRRLEDKYYVYEVTHPELNIVVNATNRNIFNTLRGPLIASNDIWELTFKLTDEAMFGLGEIPLKEDTVKIIYSHDGGLSSIPLIFANSNGSYHGLLVDNVAPTEIRFMGDNQIAVRSITRKGLKFHLFVGPKPADVMRDVMAMLGVKIKLDYWMLGAHVCSETSESNYDSAELSTFVNSASSQGVPFESHCGVAPIVFNDECNNTRIELINHGANILKDAGKRFVPHVSPYIRHTVSNHSYENDTDTRSPRGCFDNIPNFEEYIIRDPESTQLYIGQVDYHDVIYPNYENISNEFMASLWLYTAEIDAIVLENNWPLDESEKRVNETHNYLPYFNENFEGAFINTPLWNATTTVNEKYIYTHNEYGNHFSAALEKIKGPIPTLTSSQWMSMHVAINRQNIQTTWTSLQNELIEASLGGVSGHWLWSSPICGDTEHFDNETQTRLCAKWYMAASYLPLIKIHSKEFSRDPLSFVGTHRSHMITALNTRLSLLPYFYTTLQEGPLLRPMFYQFPSSEELADLTTQFMVGEDLLIVPNLQPSQSHVHVRMPPGIWYEFWSGMMIDAEEGEVVTMTTTEAEFLTLLRGGTIITMQKDVKLTADDTRLNSPFSLTVALHCFIMNTSIQTTNTTICSANGKLHMTDDITINFKADHEKLIITSKGDDFNSYCNSSEVVWANSLKELNVYGLKDDQNNYDYHRLVSVEIDLCRLRTDEEVVVNYFE